MPERNRIIPIRGDESIQDALQRIAHEATVKSQLEVGEPPIGKLMVASEYANLDPELVPKIDYCTEIGEPFGLACDDSAVIIVTKINTALWYGKTLDITVCEFRDRAALAMFVSTLLYTHHEFMSPRTVELFIQQAKKRINERQQPKPLLSDSSLSEPPQSPGSLETGDR